MSIQEVNSLPSESANEIVYSPEDKLLVFKLISLLVVTSPMHFSEAL